MYYLLSYICIRYYDRSAFRSRKRYGVVPFVSLSVILMVGVTLYCHLGVGLKVYLLTKKKHSLHTFRRLTLF